MYLYFNNLHYCAESLLVSDVSKVTKDITGNCVLSSHMAESF